MEIIQNIIKNFDITIATATSIVIYIFGYISYLKNKRSLTNIFFFIYTVFVVIWSILAVLFFKSRDPEVILYLMRIYFFSAVWINFLIYVISHLYPSEKLTGNKRLLYINLFLAVVVSIITLTPLLVSGIISVNPLNPDIQKFGIIIFGLCNIYFNLFALRNFIIKYFQNKNERIKYLIIIIAFLLTSFLVITFDFIFPNVFNNQNFIPFSGVFMLPFIISLSLGIYRYELFNIRLASAAIFVIVLLLINLFELGQSQNFIEIITRLMILSLSFLLSIFLIRAIYQEIEQREKLAELNQRLEQLNRIKSEFLSFASHQVKAPMAVIKGYAELIAENIEGVPEQAKDFAKKIKDAVDKLLVLIEQFIDYRRIEEGRMEFNFEEVEVISFIKEIVNNFTLLAKEKNLDLSFESKLDQMILKVDKIKFVQIIQNLIDNAIKYTPQGWVKISVYKENNELVICISDSGIGLSKELQGKLFGEFVRDPSIKKEIRGTGLGLYIVKYLVEAHKGKIWAESEGEGKGSKFYVRLPIT
ncbi:MAG: hypothetical protein KatS3mg095_0858 [Candidatus Parcubacteria bacterium]|nr:MAG: hypothetical protein KatS3mg095_0858 [Candidatus Parcubacteria bacterium]